jgi:glycosyltransferase involved in cell wall biosynthesis
VIHAFTPREIVRTLALELAEAYECPYVVHLEDNEDALLEVELGGPTFAELLELPAVVLDRAVPPRLAHPLYAKRFLEDASAITAVIDKLLERAPSHVPGVVAWPGHDEAVIKPVPREEARRRLHLRADDLVTAYTGNVHEANAGEIRSLFQAIASLRNDGHPAVLVKTGSDSIPRSHLGHLGEGLRDLGWQDRAALPAVLAAADVLVQPGGPGSFNDYRFPSKLPDYLASGKPVVLPRTNIGLRLEHRTDAFLLELGDAAEIRDAMLELAADGDLRDRIGRNGQRFATRELTWTQTVDAVEQAYGEALSRPSRVPGLSRMNR